VLGRRATGGVLQTKSVLALVCPQRVVLWLCRRNHHVDPGIFLIAFLIITAAAAGAAALALVRAQRINPVEMLRADCNSGVPSDLQNSHDPVTPGYKGREEQNGAHGTLSKPWDLAGLMSAMPTEN